MLDWTDGSVGCVATDVGVDDEPTGVKSMSRISLDKSLVEFSATGIARAVLTTKANAKSTMDFKHFIFAKMGLWYFTH